MPTDWQVKEREKSRLVELARVAFDIATNSMDFGSGFLDHEEVAQLRELAVALGADPWEATPHAMRASFCPALPGHAFSPWQRQADMDRPMLRWRTERVRRQCESCGKIEWDEFVPTAPPDPVA